MLDWLSDFYTHLQDWLFEMLVQPLLYALGLMAWAEPAFQSLEVVIIGLIEIAIMLTVLRPLEAWRPVEHWADRRAVRVDVIYTLLHRLGIVPLAVFLLLEPLARGIEGGLRLHGYIPPSLETLLPALASQPLLSFLLYLAILDLAEYWRHRLQHRFDWWWALHAVHHSQRQLSLWSDRRNHLLDDVLRDLWMVLVALVIGVPPDYFLGILMLTRLVESFSHANLRLDFGPARALLVSPHYHRLHHGIGVGHEGAARGCNFAALFPFWDMLFGTARFARDYPATGIRDQLNGVDYGEGFWRQQALGLRRLWGAVRGR